MALATQCPHCNTTFRVASDQLKLRGGIVRCGACHEVFDGNATLVDMAPAAPSLSEKFDVEVAEIEEKIAHEEEVQHAIETLDFDTSFDPYGALPKPEPAPAIEIDFDLNLEPPAAAAAEPEPEPEPEPEERTEPPFDAPMEQIVLDEPSILPLRPSADELEAQAAPEPESEPEPAAEELHDEPEFVRRSREQEQAARKKKILMIAGSALLALALAAQGVTTFRNVIAARFPQLIPALTAACVQLRCKLELPMQIETLAIDAGELQTLGGDTFSLVTALRNQGALAQAWPHIELTLTDANDKALLRRVLAPADYLPKGAAVARGFAAHSEQPVKLYFSVTQIKASGYKIAVFYP
jgi:predicted Zn finger-like uncharacterized protein